MTVLACQRTEGTRVEQQAKVGIFWLLRGQLIHDFVPLSRAESYGPCLSYPGGHEGVWECWKRQHRVPHDEDYEAVPRGRISFDIIRQHFLFVADDCILRLPEVVATIMHVFQLPQDSTDKMLDLRYRCRDCLRHPAQ